MMGKETKRTGPLFMDTGPDAGAESELELQLPRAVFRPRRISERLTAHYAAADRLDLGVGLQTIDELGPVARTGERPEGQNAALCGRTGFATPQARPSPCSCFFDQVRRGPLLFDRLQRDVPLATFDQRTSGQAPPCPPIACYRAPGGRSPRGPASGRHRA